MTIESKINLLQNNILHSEKCYDIVTYRLLQNHNLQNTILKNEKEINDKSFIDLLDRLVNLFRNQFYEINSTEYNINCIIDSNINRIENYLLSNIDVYDNNNIKYIKEQSYKLFISNFIHNLRYIDLFENILNERNIKIKDIDNYSLDECTKIVQLLSDFVFCMKGRDIIVYLFQDIEKDIEYHLKNNEDKKYSDDYHKNIVINHYKIQYERMIDSYNNKKEYLKYFEY